MTAEEILRAHCMDQIHKLCHAEGLPLPPHVEESDDGGARVLFRLGLPDRRRWAIAYERPDMPITK